MLLRTLFFTLAAAATLAAPASPRLFGRNVRLSRDTLNDKNLVTWDESSLFVRRQRVLFFSAEFHPFRLPVPALWRDVFEKIRAMGYNGVSFYIDWALLEGEQGVIRDDGIFDLKPFFAAAQQTGIYLLARPGPYINAEVAGGGFPGWQVRNPATLRTDDEGYLSSTQLYMSTIGALIAEAQITNGGPVILVQPENEYTVGPDFPQPQYMEYVEQQLRNAGIVVPLMNNDAYPAGNFAPGTQGGVDIYGYDGYPLGFNCADPSNWGSNSLPTYYGSDHSQQSPNTPNSIVEFQGGSFDPWGGVGFDKCASLLNYQFENVFYKNDFGQGVKMLNLYMTFGGTNWGNLGHDRGYTSYDYGAAIAEDRTITRQKYGEAKLIANGLRASPAFLTAVAQSNSNGAGAYTGNSNVFVSGVFSNTTKFFVARQNAYYSTSSVSYALTVPTSQGNVTIPQLGGQLSLVGRDSKIHVTDFQLGHANLLYSSAEIFTYQKIGSRQTLVLYGDDGQTHEFAIAGAGQASLIQGSGATIKTVNGSVVVNTKTGSTRQIVKFSNGLFVHIVDRYTAYDYWVINSSGTENGGLPIVHMDSGYLIRNVQLSGSVLTITGDLNTTSNLEVIGTPKTLVKTVVFNGNALQVQRDSKTGIISGTATYTTPQVSVPDLSQVTWKMIDGLPEIQPGYDDSKWTSGSLSYTNNTDRPLNTPTSLYGGDYGYHTGSLLYRGHFTAAGNESQLQLSPQGGYAFAYTLWLNDTYIGNWAGNGNNYYYYGTFDLPQLQAGANYVFTVLIDHMGYEENYDPGIDQMKQPRGVMQYTLGNRTMEAITWKLTGNLGGEQYIDKARGPLNEGGMYAERQGYHLPGAPTSSWNASTPMQGFSQAGVHFYSTTFNLKFPKGYDIPLSVDFGSSAISSTAAPARAVIFVNGYQFGKFVSNIGPQTNFPIPQGIWNYQGKNTLAVELWAIGSSGASLPNLNLVAGQPVQSGFGSITASPQPKWRQRAHAY